MSGPWARLLESAAFSAGKQIGKVTKVDLPPPPIKWTHAEKISELADDAGLSPTYLESLIRNSTKKEHFDEIRTYLLNSLKTENISLHDHSVLLEMVNDRLLHFRYQEVMKGMVELVQQHMPDLFT